MNKFYYVFALFMTLGTICSAALIPEKSIEVQGVDVRNKNEKYLLYIGKENIVLEERTYKLMKLTGHKKELVTQGELVSSGTDLKNDTEAIWLGDKAEMKIGRMTGNRSPKQIIVLKLKDLNKTFAFELFHKL